MCTSDFHPSSPATCATCNKLIEATDISNQVLAAVDEARGGDDGRVKGWRTSRDARHVIVQLDLGWTRRLVVAVPHGGGEPEAIVKHSIFGSTKIKG
ncbi:MAG: hypothetical protein IT361_06395 [Gemmatimonadaceae bacterium]|nr:hypothetical protein [Gemmatimonadaceae bacterium]